MKTSFIVTQLTLLTKLASRESDENELAWSRFFDFYYPAMLKYATLFCDATDAEDIVQRVLVKLVKILREKRYKQSPYASFRVYLMTLIRNEFIDFHRAEVSRAKNHTIPIDTAEIVAEDDPTVRLDIEWRIALHAAATEHVLERTALSESMRRAYRLYVVEGVSVQEVAERLGVTKNYVVLAKSRINQRIRAVEAVYKEEK